MSSNKRRRDELIIRHKLYIRVAITLVLVTICIFATTYDMYADLSLDYVSVSDDNNNILPIPRMLNAEEIIQQSYMNTFGVLSIEKLCSIDVDSKTCYQALLLEATKENRTITVPWWLITLLRDVHIGFWNNLTIQEPPIDFCTIEKVATTQWRNVQRYLNENLEPSKSPMPVNLNATRLEERRKQAKHINRVVFLRDPLEKLLSGYINKCVTPWRRRVEGHCEPNNVFNGSDLTAQIETNRKQMFAAYVDALPLKWNLHFIPQSLYCDGLFRLIGSYDFVGYMDNNFYKSLSDLVDKLGRDNKLPDAIEKVFHLKDNLAKGIENVGTETQAKTHVMEYYTAASLRRALEYFAIDYLMLDLTIPSWVNDILDEETTLFPQR